jgi:hypothetical protein
MPPIIGPPGPDMSCADNIGADMVLATIAAASIEIFIVIFLSGSFELVDWRLDSHRRMD